MQITIAVIPGFNLTDLSYVPNDPFSFKTASLKQFLKYWHSLKLLIKFNFKSDLKNIISQECTNEIEYNNSFESDKY
jgi:hypothetical protein